MVEKNSSWGKMSLRLSALEAPSCYLAFRLEKKRQGKDLTVGVSAIQQPDPRQGHAEKPFELLSYRSLFGLKTDAKVLVPPPDPKIRAGIGAIAQQPYQLGRWCDLGRAYAAVIGDAGLADVLATMVHPTPPPLDRPSWEWVQRLQFATCSTVAGMGQGAPR